MKVILIYPNQDYEAFAELMLTHNFTTVHPRPNPMISLGMLYLVGELKRMGGIDIAYVDNNSYKFTVDQLVAWIKGQNPDILCLGGTLSEWTQAKDIAKHFEGTKTTTIYGGPNASANPEKHVKYFDFVFRGWAEEGIKRFVQAFLLGDFEAFESIKGLCWKEHIVPPALDININKIGYPARNAVSLKSYKRKQFDVITPIDIVVASRGCPFDCSFCSSKSIWNRCYKVRYAKDVIEEIKFMRDTYGTNAIHFREDNLVINQLFLEELCAGLKELQMKWICQARIDVLNKRMVKTMKDSGCEVICCGFESANDSTLEYIDKGFTFKQVCDAIQMFEDVGIQYSGGFMVGVLNEGEKEIKNTLEFVQRVSKLPHSRIPRGAGRFVGFPVSKTYNEMLENDLVAYNWQEGELLIPNTYKLSAKQVEKCIERYW